ncbi:RidA family protein [Mycobacterium sp. WMMD1722]|uniref:RidA family protein n=1 Tax=Mycobacterium sp. WMMD1722 TaxID=3404117 RepID=UPI003BF5FA03
MRSGGQQRSDPGNGSWSARLSELGIELPEVVAPLAAYLPAVRTGNLVYTAGQLPIVGGELTRTGKVGAEVDPEDARQLARLCGLNALAAVHALVGVDAITRVVKVVGFVASAPGFGGQPGVVNGASELFGEVFGDAGAHARSAVGVSELPRNAPVEVEIIVEVG